MVPLVIGGLAALWGVSEYSDAKDNLRSAKNINSQAAAIAEEAKKEVDEIHKKMLNSLNTVGATKKKIMIGDFKDFSDMIVKIRKNYKFNNDTEGLRELDRFGINDKLINQMQDISQQAINLSNMPNEPDGPSGVGVLGIIGAGVFTSAAVVIAPLYLMMKSDEAKAALYEAKTRMDQAKYYQETCKNIGVLFKAIDVRSRQINYLLNELNVYFEPAVRTLREISIRRNYSFTGASKEEKIPIFYAHQLGETIKKIIDKPIIQNDWSINPDIEHSIELVETNVKMIRSAN